MVLIDNKKCLRRGVPQSWIIHCLKIYKISTEVIKLIEKNMENWRVDFTTGGNNLAEIKIQSDLFQWEKVKEKIFKKYPRRMRKLLETELYSRNLLKMINTWAVPPRKILGIFLKWTREELKQMDQKTGKLMMMHKALHPRDGVDRIYE